MMTWSNGNIFRVTGEFPAQRPVTRSFDVFFDLRPNNDWVNNCVAGDLRRFRPQYDVTVMCDQVAMTIIDCLSCQFY